jgi:hypothetical protein
MDKELIDKLWNKATQKTLQNGELNERYHFAKLVSDAEAKRMQDEGMVTIGHMREQVSKEREACAKLFPEPHKEYFGRDIQDAIRARGFQ